MTAEIADERRARRGWILPLLLLIAASALYARIALEPALPLVIPALLERSVAIARRTGRVEDLGGLAFLRRPVWLHRTYLLSGVKFNPAIYVPVHGLSRRSEPTELSS